ncbi:MAG: 2-deoxyglucose-6-phosphatase [Methanomassiliicoccales archaeon PtaU1.Bin124]|nr:MAG: 2-deoxyglucose-6-phosphatase [Methanomassiliicoccales archaeon PtaU1.Bin124]
MDKPYRGVIFDLDGTLVHSTIDFSLMREQVMAALKEMPIPPDLLEQKGAISNNVLKALTYLEGKVDHGKLTALLDRLENVSTQVELRDVERTTMISGVKEVLDHIQAKGYRIGLLTRGSREYAMRALRASGLNFPFQATVCRDDFDLREAKPNPIALVRTADLLGLDPSGCVFIGDHFIDQQCAEAAGSGFVGVLTGSNDWEKWSKRPPLVVLISVAELPGLLPQLDGHKVY